MQGCTVQECKLRMELLDGGCLQPPPTPPQQQITQVEVEMFRCSLNREVLSAACCVTSPELQGTPCKG